jgi:hypothetical protein
MQLFVRCIWFISRFENLELPRSFQSRGEMIQRFLLFALRRILDNLPVAMVKVRTENGNSFKTYERGYPVGFKAAIEVSLPSLADLALQWVWTCNCLYHAGRI